MRDRSAAVAAPSVSIARSSQAKPNTVRPSPISTISPAATDVAKAIVTRLVLRVAQVLGTTRRARARGRCRRRSARPCRRPRRRCPRRTTPRCRSGRPCACPVKRAEEAEPASTPTVKQRRLVRGLVRRRRGASVPDSAGPMGQSTRRRWPSVPGASPAAKVSVARAGSSRRRPARGNRPGESRRKETEAVGRREGGRQEERGRHPGVARSRRSDGRERPRQTRVMRCFTDGSGIVGRMRSLPHCPNGYLRTRNATPATGRPRLRLRVDDQARIELVAGRRPVPLPVVQVVLEAEGRVGKPDVVEER